MISFQCKCGKPAEQPETEINKARKCQTCGAIVMCISAEPLLEGSGTADFDAVLRAPPTASRKSVTWRLGGCDPLLIGALPDRLVRLSGPMVSRAHCQLVRVDFGPSRWRLQDTNSRTGTFVNGQRITEHELQHGDFLRIGEYELVYEVDSPLALAPSGENLELAPVAAVATVAPRRAQPTAVAVPDDTPDPSGRKCPSCQRLLRKVDKICVPCGIYTDTGRPLLTSQVDEDAVYATAEQVIKVVSFLVPITLLPIPIAADARGKHRPYAIWAIAAITTLCSLIYFFAGWSDEFAMADWMLWPNNPDLPFGTFHFSQLITHTLIHSRESIIGFLLHLGGNMLFLLVFGTRVNSLIGNLATAIIYPVLAIGSGLMYLASVSAGHAVPLLGASGAINGLAGLYLVLLPAHRVYCAVWIRITMLMLFRTWFAMKIFALRGFWILLIYFGYDVLIASVGFQDGTAHWAHIGGFLTGFVIGAGLLLSRQFNCRNGDILSVILGQHAWPLIGKPSQWARCASE